MRAVIKALVALLALFLGVEVGLTFLVQGGLERALRSRQGFPGDLQASVSSFPMAYNLARSRLSEVRLVWEGSMEVDGAPERAATYTGVVVLRDVEIDLAALMRGSLKLRSLSLLKAELRIGGPAVSLLLGMGEDSEVEVGEDGLEVRKGAERYEYEVKVSGERELVFQRLESVNKGSSLPREAEPLLEGAGVMVLLGDLPLGARLRKVSSTRGYLCVEVSVPEWESLLREWTGALEKRTFQSI